MADDATIRFYQTQAPAYTASGAQGQSRHLEPFLKRLSPGARVLELGCGGGRDAAFMAGRGFDVDATDGTPAMARKANERTGLPTRVLLFEDIDAHEEYDAVWAHACLLHAARDELPGFLDAIHRTLRPNGLHYANYKLGDGEGRDLLGRLHNFPGEDWLEETYRAASFDILKTERYAGNASDGTQRDWLALTVRKT